MSELCKHDEQVLDYLYGELAEVERADFAKHLAGCESCRREIDSLSGVRNKAAELPRPVLAPDAAAKMTAQLMEAAIAATKTKASPAPMGGGKIVPLPSGRVRRVLTHPTTAALTIAAAALFLLVFKSKEPAAPVSDAPAATPTGAATKAKAEPPLALPGAATTQVPVIETVTESKPGAADNQPVPPKPAPQQAGPQKTGFFDGRFTDSTTRARSQVPATAAAAEAPKKLVWAAPTGAPTAASTATPPVAKPTATYELANNDRKAASAKSEAPDDSRFAQPPPPPASYGSAPSAASTHNGARDEEAAPAGVVAQSKARQQQRTMDELERAELAQAPVPSAGDGYSYGRRNVAADSAGPVGNLSSGSGGAAKDVQSDDDVANSLGKHAPAVDKVAEKADKAADRTGPLTQVYEQIRSGHCVEARDLLHKLERSFPGTPGLVDANTAWQKDCGVRMQLQNLQPQLNQQNVQPQNLPQQNVQQRGSYAPVMPSPSAPAPRLEKMPMESPPGLGNREQQGMELRRSAMKKPASAPAPIQKAPAKAKASKAAATDLAL